MTKNILLRTTQKTTQPFFVFVFVSIVFPLCTSALAAEDSGEAINWSRMPMGLLVGLALFLFGMQHISEPLT